MTLYEHKHAAAGRCYTISRPDGDNIYTAVVVWIIHSNGGCTGNVSTGYGDTPANALISACEGSRKFGRAEHMDPIELWSVQAESWPEGMPT